MKKWFAAMLCALFVFVAACAGEAEGLTGDLSGLLPAGGAWEIGTVPDPGAILDNPGMLIQENYSFLPDLVCDAYTYSLPYSSEAALFRFVNAYVEEAGLRGYTVTETTANGYRAYQIAHPGTGLYSLLLPEFEGEILFLRNVDMEFGDAPSNPYSDEEIARILNSATEDFLSFTYNGRRVEMTADPNAAHYHESVWGYIEARFRSEDAQIAALTLNIPDGAAAGDTFDVRSDIPPAGLALLVDGETGFDGPVDPNHFRCYFKIGSARSILGALRGDADTFRLNIHSIDYQGDSAVITGTFSGTFNDGGEIFHNGLFRATVPQYAQEQVLTPTATPEAEDEAEPVSAARCWRCHGKGLLHCTVCDGTGRVSDGDGEAECSKCYGTGEMTCRDCLGTGLA